MTPKLIKIQGKCLKNLPKNYNATIRAFLGKVDSKLFKKQPMSNTGAPREVQCLTSKYIGKNKYLKTEIK